MLESTKADLVLWRHAAIPGGCGPIEGATDSVVVYTLVFCPPIEQGARYSLVKCDAAGSRVLVSGEAMHAHPPLNLAVVRQLGARLGANEVHVFGGSDA